MAKRHDRLAHALFNQFPAPLLRAEFARKGGLWHLDRMRAIGTAEIGDEHKPFVMEQAAAYFSRPRYPGRAGPQARFDLAILYDPQEENGPSDAGAIRRFERAARRLNIQPYLIGQADYARVPEYDALFIRETTQVNHHTYRFARRAAAEGMVVIDDPESIVRCTNKVYLAEVFTRNRIATPRTMIVHKDNVDAVGKEIGLPCVLKRPDSSFSMGVMKAETPEELKAQAGRILAKSELAVAQEFLPSDFDWRIGVLNRKPIYACKYHMARGHWQIQTSEGGRTRYGRVEPVPLERVPPRVLRLARRSAGLIGDGLYGVDLKDLDGRAVTMEVNDNPSIEAGDEDAFLKDELYLSIMREFLARLEKQERRSAR